MEVGAKVTVKPSKGCCNSTLCMFEWVVKELSEVQFGPLNFPMALIEYEDRLEVVQLERLSKL